MVGRQAWQRILEQARLTPDIEVCGLVGAGADGLSLYPCRNSAEDPQQTFQVHPQDQLRAYDAMREANERLGAIYHSHPEERAWPSSRDVIGSQDHPDTPQIIVGRPGRTDEEIRAFLIKHEEVLETDLGEVLS
jgi:proteasome lid subunit RPN8/RPN11